MTERVESNLENISEIGLNVFSDDLETLKLVMYSYEYVYRQLNKSNYEETNLDLYKDLLKQEKILVERMKTTLKTIECNCQVQLWLNEEYEDPLLLNTRKNTELIKWRIQKYLRDCKKKHYTGQQIKKWISRLLISIKSMGHEVKISELDKECMDLADLDEMSFNMVDDVPLSLSSNIFFSDSDNMNMNNGGGSSSTYIDSKGYFVTTNNEVKPCPKRG